MDNSSDTTKPATDPAQAAADPAAEPATDPAQAAADPAAEPATEDSTETKPLDTDLWGDTGTEVGNSVLQVLQDSGISVEDAKALLYDPLTVHNDPTKIDKSALAAKIGKSRAVLVMAGITNYVNEHNVKSEATIKSIHEVAGGKENWERVAPWAKTNVSEAKMSEYIDMVNKGGELAKFAASEMVRMYNEDSNNTSLETGAGSLEGTGVAADSGEALTKAQYAEQLDKEYRFGKPNMENVRKIQAARERGRRKGI